MLGHWRKAHSGKTFDTQKMPTTQLLSLSEHRTMFINPSQTLFLTLSWGHSTKNPLRVWNTKMTAATYYGVRRQRFLFYKEHGPTKENKVFTGNQQGQISRIPLVLLWTSLQVAPVSGLQPSGLGTTGTKQKAFAKGTSKTSTTRKVLKPRAPFPCLPWLWSSLSQSGLHSIKNFSWRAVCWKRK